MKRKVLIVASTLLLLVGVVGMFLAPIPISENVSDPLSYKIFYFHVPIAWVAYLAFLVVFIACFQYLRTKDEKWDTYAHASAEVGVVFCTLVLICGSIWTRATWGVFWTWDPRLTTSLVLWLLYIGYLMLRQALDEPEKRARLSASYGIVAFIGVPLSYASVKIWSSLHPDLTAQGGGLSGEMTIATLLLNIVAFTVFYVVLFTAKTENERLREKVQAAKRSALR